MIWKILKSEFKQWQAAGVITVMLLGFSIILLAARFYTDIRPMFKGSDLWQHEHIIISKKISQKNTASQILGKGDKPSFSKVEIDSLRMQPFIKSLAVFTSSSFEASAHTDGTLLGGFYTELFFESVPSKYIDLKDQNWTWTLESEFIPIILPKSYLNLYNFGFATSQNLPQITEKAAFSVPFRIRIRGNRKIKNYQARIVGFSDRLNTILVPQEFLDYANPKYGTKKVPVSRIVLLTPDPSDPELLNYIESKQYDYNKEQLNNGKARMLLNTATAIVIITGLIISALALWLFILSSQLLLQRNRHKIEMLKALGFSTAQIVKPFIKISIFVSAVVFFLSLIPYFLVTAAYRNALQTLLPDATVNHILILLIGFVFIATLSVFNLLIIRKKLHQI
ncbi:MAG: FtsX-like permease family protein [Bacteroidota bacterium]|nr:FtsX-like permease family protein [Bacteroidota bacterium]